MNSSILIRTGAIAFTGMALLWRCWTRTCQ